MADNKSIATRDSYGAALLELADAGHDDIVVFDADLSASTRTSVFAKKYSERFFDCGIAECNMVGVAAGMSTFGYVPFVSSFAMFAAGRAFEQIRNSIGYPELNVKIAATHGGLSVGEDGATHQCVEDFAIMRAIPGMLVLCPCDGNEMRLAVEALVGYEGPAYMRLGRLAVETVTERAYQPIGEDAYARAQALVRQCGNAVCCLDLFGPVNEKNRVLRDWAQQEGLLRSKSELENIT